MLKNPYNPEKQTFRPLKMRGMTVNAFLTNNKEPLEKKTRYEVLPYHVAGVSFNMIKIPVEYAPESPTGILIQMGETEVTQGLFQAVMGWNNSYYQGNPQNPVEMVTWEDCVLFCNKLSERLNLQSCYEIVKKKRYLDITCDRTKNGFRLPTEKEWLICARAGVTLRWSGTDEEENIDSYVWHADNSGGETHPVGQLKPNAWGLYDMSGNVGEWCAEENIILGGSCISDKLHCNVSSRSVVDDSYHSFNTGFRICKNA